MQIRFVQTEGKKWFDSVDEIADWVRMQPGGRNPGPLPPHFLKVVFPKLGGRVVEVLGEGERLAVGFLFPRGQRESARFYVLRFYSRDRMELVGAWSELEHHLNPDGFVLFDVSHRKFIQTQEVFEGFDFGRPSETEAMAIHAMQKEIWGSEDAYLYPADIHAENAGLGTSIVARIDGVPAAFLMGFHRFGSAQLPEQWAGNCDGSFRLESQLLGVSPRHRRKGLGFLLKKYQAKKACEAGISLINWTADPLQFRNAGLNFHRLGAISGEACPNYIPFRNELNQSPASRLVLTWLVNSKRVGNKLYEANKAADLTLDRFPKAVQVNSGCEEGVWDAGSPAIAIEIPKDWTSMQSGQQQLAAKWRQLTDDLLIHYLGFSPGKYILTDVAENGERKYLIALRADDELLKELVHQ